MEQIQLARVSAFSSEDPAYPASNLLKDEIGYSWKCHLSKTKKLIAFVILQFDSPQRIDTITIGNEGSSFIEVWVNQSNRSKEDKVLLARQAFMKQNESNLRRFRMFSQHDFATNVADKEWDTVKIVCHRPISSLGQYGLSFVTFLTGARREVLTRDQNLQTTEFNTLFRCVKFALSGFCNPERSEIRNKMMEMGASYSPDFDSSCSHLICAFVDTPRYLTAMSRRFVTVVTKHWALDSYAKKEKLMWFMYKLNES